MTTNGFAPFADAASVATIDGLSIENGPDRIVVHGALELARDRRGLERARTLAALFEAAARALAADPALPDALVSAVVPPSRVRNPFA